MAFLLFSGATESPKGGAADLVGRYPTLEAATAAIVPSRYHDCWAHVLCLDSLKIVVSYFYCQTTGRLLDD